MVSPEPNLLNILKPNLSGSQVNFSPLQLVPSYFLPISLSVTLLLSLSACSAVACPSVRPSVRWDVLWRRLGLYSDFVFSIHCVRPTLVRFSIDFQACQAFVFVIVDTRILDTRSCCHTWHMRHLKAIQKFICHAIYICICTCIYTFTTYDYIIHNKY